MVGSSNTNCLLSFSDITIVSEKEGNTTIAHNGGRTSADLRPPSRSSGGKPDRSPSLSKINKIYELTIELIIDQIPLFPTQVDP